MKSLLVGLERLSVAQAISKTAEQDTLEAGWGAGSLVINPEALLTPEDKTMLAKISQVARDGRLRKPERLVQVAHADLSIVVE